MLIFVFLICFSFCNSQQIIHLNSLKGYNFENPINSKPPYSVYISANRDSEDILSQVYIKSESGSLQNLLYLKNSSKNSNSGVLAATAIQENSFLISKLTDYQLYSLTGILYITNTSQADDNKFQVYDVSKSIAIATGEKSNQNLVFLNSKSQNHSSTISSWLQTPSCLVSIYKGFPKENREDNLVIFSNPAPFFTQSLFIPHVEKFEVNFEIFYFKISGSMKFNISPEPFHFDGYQTTKYRTTGFYMKSQFDNTNRTATVSCLRDTRYNGTTGLLIGAFRVRPYSTVRFYFEDGPHSMDYIVDLGIRGTNVFMIPESLKISTSGTEDGEVYVQYFIWQDQIIPSTLAPTTTTLPETTTKGLTVNQLLATWTRRQYRLVVLNQAFGSAQLLPQLYVEQPIDGVIGFGFPAMSVNGTRTPLDGLMPMLDQQVFSIWMDRKIDTSRGGPGGLVTFGAMDTVNCFADVNWVPLTVKSYSGFDLDGFKIGTFQVISDTGSGWIGAPPTVISAIVKATGAKYDWNLELYVVPCSTMKTQPDIKFTINGMEYTIPSVEYILDLLLENGKCALTFFGMSATGFGPTWVLGDTFIRSYCHFYDYGNMRIGLAKAHHLY